MKNNNQELIKKNLFKVKKISIKTIKSIKLNGDAEYIVDNVGVGILVPAFNSYSSKFEEDRVQVLTIDGRSIDVKQKSVVLDNTRIMDAKVKEKLNNVIAEAKKIYEQQKKLVKHQEEYEKIKKSLKEKLNKSQDSLSKSFTQLKKVRGFLSNEEVIKYLNKNLGKKLNKEFEQSSYSENKFTITLLSNNNYGGSYNRKILELYFNKDSVSMIRVVKEIDFGKWCANHYDFVYEEYDRTLHVGDLENSSDFKKIKSKYFKSNNTSAILKKANAEECFDAGVGDKDSLSVCHIVSSERNLECKKENLKELENRINSLLVLV